MSRTVFTVMNSDDPDSCFGTFDRRDSADRTAEMLRGYGNRVHVEEWDPRPTRAEVLALMPHDPWCKSGGSDHADCCRDEMASCACIASESLAALVEARLLDVQGGAA